MVKRFCILIVLTSIAGAVSGDDSQQPPPVGDPAFKPIQEISVPKEYMVMRGMKVSGDGSMVLYVVQLAGESLEYAAVANSTRLPNQLLDMAKTQREKTGDTRISVDPADYRFTMIDELLPSPLWQGVVYGAMTAKAGPMVLVNRLKIPDFPSAYAVSGAFPGWFYSDTGGESAAFWAQKDGKIKLFADGETEIEEGALPGAPVVIRGKHKAYVLISGNRRSLFLDGKKVCSDYDSIESALFQKDKSGDYKVAYIAKNGDKSTLVVDGQVQQTEFTPAHDLVIASGGSPIAYAAADKGREFVIMNGARITKDKDFTQVRMLTFGQDKSQVAYVAREGQKEWVMINDKKVTPEYAVATFCQEQFRITGDLTFAGLDDAKSTIVVGTLHEPAKVEAPKQN